VFDGADDADGGFSEIFFVVADKNHKFSAARVRLKQ
jgi:hypothetical protein